MLWLCYFYGLKFSFGALGCGGGYGESYVRRLPRLILFESFSDTLLVALF